MQVFGFPLSPFVRKVHLVAEEKGVETEMVLVSPRNPSEDFAAASPFRKIPALKHGDYTLADSTAIVTYIDALHPEPAMLPADPQARGKAIWFEEVSDTVMIAAGGKILFNRFVGPKLLNLPGDEAVALQGEVELAPILDYLESVMPEQGWLAGSHFSIGDIAIASCFKSLGYVGLEPDAAKHPATAAWYGRVCARPAWQAVVAREAKVVPG